MPDKTPDPFQQLIQESIFQNRNRRLLGKNQAQIKAKKAQKKQDELTRQEIARCELQHKLLIAQIAERNWINAGYILYVDRNTCPCCGQTSEMPYSVHFKQVYRDTTTWRSQEIPNFQLPDNYKLPRLVKVWREATMPCSSCYRSQLGEGKEVELSAPIMSQHLRELTEKTQALTQALNDTSLGKEEEEPINLNQLFL